MSSLHPLSRYWHSGLPAALHLGEGSGKCPALETFCCSPPRLALRTGEVLSPLPSLSSVRSRRRNMAPGLLHYPPGLRGPRAPADLGPLCPLGFNPGEGDLSNGLEWIGRWWL